MKLKIIGLLAIVTLTTELHAQETTPVASQPKELTAAQQQYRALILEYLAAEEKTGAEYQRSSSEQERRRIIENRSAQKTTVAAGMFEIAKRHPGDPYAAAALVWIVRNLKVGQEVSTAVRLLERYVTDQNLHPAFETLALVCPANSETFLQGVMEKNPRRELKGLACYSLARMLYATANEKRATWPAAPAATRPDGATPDELVKRAEELFAQVIESYGDVPYRVGGTLAAAATQDLFDLRHFAVGKVAPEIEGEDIEGVRFKLSDYRGKVVVVVFSGNWCAPCKAMYPQHRLLVTRHADKPFALLAVNSDRDRETVKQSMAKEEITWRCWWDGDIKGPIATQYRVRVWPAIFVVDAQGVIRYRDVRAEALDQAVDTLLADVAA